MTLNNVIKLYIPSNIKGIVNKELQELYTNKAIELLSLKYGGATLNNTIGAWLDNNNNIVKEDITVVYSYMEDTIISKEIIEFMEALKNDMQQDAVTIEFNQSMTFI